MGAGVFEAELLLGHADAAVAARVRGRLGTAAEGGDAPGVATPATAAPTRVAGLDGAALIARLRADDVEDARDVLDGAGGIDWPLVVREHRRTPFSGAVRARLVARDDCPAEVVLALVVALSAGRPVHDTRALDAALRRGVVTPRRVALEAAPGWSAIRTLEHYSRSVGGRRLAPIERLLDEAAALLPGDDLLAWLWLIGRTPTHPGTFPELCADAVRAARTDAPGLREAAQATRWDESAMPVVSGSTQLAWAALSPAGMLGRVDPAIAARVVAALPVNAIRGFLDAAEVAVRVVVPAIRRAPELTTSLVHIAPRTRESVRALLALHDPEVNGALLFLEPSHADIGHAVHLATRQDAPRRVPLSAAVRRRLRYDGNPHRYQGAQAVYGHHPDLIRIALETGKNSLGTARTLRGLLGLWECRGRAALYDPKLRRRLDRASAEILRFAGHGSRGLERLRAAVAQHESPAALIAAIRADPGRAGQPLPRAFWPAAVLAHARDPLPAAALSRLALHWDCPVELSLTACRTDPTLAPFLADRSPAHASATLRHPLPVPPLPGPAGQTVFPVGWYVHALAHELLSIREFVELAHPAPHLLQAVRSLAPFFPEGHAEARRVIAEHTSRTLGDNPDAWAVAVRLAPDFPGTLPELAATAAAVFD